MKSYFDEICSDIRLHRVLGNNEQRCRIQIWILQTKKEDTKSRPRLIYARALPSTELEDKWTAPMKVKFEPIVGDLLARVIPLNLYCSATKLKKLVGNLIQGENLKNCAASISIELTEKLAKEVGDFKLDNNLTIRPVVHLPNRDNFLFESKRLSPNFYASYDSAAITSLDKIDIFSVDNITSSELLKYCCKLIKAETGMNFSNIDSWRIGDIEFLVAPGLSDDEKHLYSVEATNSEVTVTLHQRIASYASSLLIRIQAFNDGTVYQCYTDNLPNDAVYPVNLVYKFDKPNANIIDAFTFDLEALQEDERKSNLCVRYAVRLVRQVSLNTKISSGQRFKSDWLALNVPNEHEARLSEVQLITRGNNISSSTIGGRTDDPWVIANRAMTNFMGKVNPPVSEARFYPRLADSNNVSRIDLADWLIKLLQRNEGNQVYWFDPFMEDVGINLLNMHGSMTGDYIIFTTCRESKPKTALSTIPVSVPQKIIGRYRHPRWLNKANNENQKNAVDNRISNLIETCRAWCEKHGSIRLRVIALRSKALHDRMIITRSKNLEPVEGFHISNSIQRANLTYPLLVTPIPDDVLWLTLDYANTIMEKEFNKKSTSNGDEAKILFDSNHHDSRPKKQNFSRTSAFFYREAGNVLAWWLSLGNLKGLRGNSLINKLNEMGLMADDSLRDKIFDDLPSSFWTDGFPFEDFNAAWDVLGNLLAVTHAGDFYDKKINQAIIPLFSKKLTNYLDWRREDALPTPERRYDIDVYSLIVEDLESLLHEVHDPYRALHHTTEVSWPDYYAIKLLWCSDPIYFINWIENKAQNPFPNNERDRATVTCALRHIATQISQSGIDVHHAEALLASCNGYLQWNGFVAIAELIESGRLQLCELDKLNYANDHQYLRLIAWMLQRIKCKPSFNEELLVKKLISLLPESLSENDFADLLEMLRGHMNEFYDSEVWILKKVLAPLIIKGRLAIDYVTKKWLECLIPKLNLSNDRHHATLLPTDMLFSTELAYLIVFSSPLVQESVLKTLRQHFDACIRYIRVPMARQINYDLYHKACHISIWISAIAKRTSLLILDPGSDTARTLQDIIVSAGEIISSLPVQRMGLEIVVGYADIDTQVITADPLISQLRAAVNLTEQAQKSS